MEIMGGSSTADLFDDSKFANMSNITVENSELEYSQTECSNVSGILNQVTKGIFDNSCQITGDVQLVITS